jgi:hypothetical protein
MDVELREALNHGFGPEPLHRPLADRLEAGHRAVRRRRAAGSVVAVAAAAVVGIGASLLAGGSPDSTRGVATDPTATSSPTSSPETAATTQSWDDDELARYSDDGMVEIRPGVTVLHQIDEPYGDPSDYNHSVALAVEYRGAESWLLLTWETDPNGASTSASGTMAYPEGSFADWVEQNVAANEDNSGGVVRFAEDGWLASSHGVVILDQVRDPDLPGNFAPDGVRTAAALLQGPDGKKWYVLVRDIDELETISTPFRMGGGDLQEFLDYARAKYVSGEGLR